MNEVFRKLQVGDHEPVWILRSPPEFQPHLDEIAETTRIVNRDAGKRRFGFALVFVKRCSEIADLAPRVVDRLENDGLLWFAYPKKSSSRYSADIGRDDSWQPLGDLGYEGVRQIAIDEDWSALRFRHVDHIKTLRRDPSRAMSRKGKRRLNTSK